MYRLMYLCRHLEATCCRLNPRWFPAEGEEATIVGAFYGLRLDDFISPHYRGPFTAYLLKGASMAKLIGQALAKSTRLLAGPVGSIHRPGRRERSAVGIRRPGHQPIGRGWRGAELQHGS